MTAVDEPKHDPTKFECSDTRHGVAHALASVHFRQSFSSIDVDTHGHHNVVDPSVVVDPEMAARIALAGPCLDLAVVLVEDSDLGLDVVGGTVEGWRQDVEDGHAAGTDLIAATGWIERAVEWSLAFVWQNADVIEEATVAVMDAGRAMSYESFAAQFRSRTVEPGTACREDARNAFAGLGAELTRIDELVLAERNCRPVLST